MGYELNNAQKQAVMQKLNRIAGEGYSQGRLAEIARNEAVELLDAVNERGPDVEARSQFIADVAAFIEALDSNGEGQEFNLGETQDLWRNHSDIGFALDAIADGEMPNIDCTAEALEHLED